MFIALVRGEVIPRVHDRTHGTYRLNHSSNDGKHASFSLLSHSEIHPSLVSFIHHVWLHAVPLSLFLSVSSFLPPFLQYSFGTRGTLSDPCRSPAAQQMPPPPRHGDGRLARAPPPGPTRARHPLHLHPPWPCSTRLRLAKRCQDRQLVAATGDGVGTVLWGLAAE